MLDSRKPLSISRSSLPSSLLQTELYNSNISNQLSTLSLPTNIENIAQSIEDGHRNNDDVSNKSICSSQSTRSSLSKTFNPGDDFFDETKFQAFNNNEGLVDAKPSDAYEEKNHRFIEISRNILDIDSLAIKAGKQISHSYQNKNDMRKFFDKPKNFDLMCSPLDLLYSYVPICKWLPEYSIRSHLGPDIVAGLTISVLHIPQGIAYSMLAGLDPVHGLYVAFFPVLLYVLLGTSPHISIGTFAVVSIMLNNIAIKLGASQSNFLKNNTIIQGASSNDDLNVSNPTVLEIVTSVCLLSGLIQILMGLLRLGSLSLILSEQLVSSFSTAISFHVATSQLNSIFGLTNRSSESGPFKLIKIWMKLPKHFDQINLYCLIFSCITISILIFFKEYFETIFRSNLSAPSIPTSSIKSNRRLLPLPIDLIVVISSIVVSWFFKFDQNFKIEVVKNVPTGLPKPIIPRLDLFPNILLDSITISILCFAVSLSLAKIFAKKHNLIIRPNQELLALGTANVFASFFQAFPASAALSRSTLQEKTGAKTQIAGLISSLVILIVLLYLAPFLYHLPKFTLSCIILVALKSMFLQLKDIKLFWNISKLDGASWLITFLSVIILDIDYGLSIGIMSNIIVVLLKLTFPKISTLGHLAATEIYDDKKLYQNLIEYPGIKIFRFYSPLFYLNAQFFKEEIFKLFPTNSSVKQILIIDFSCVPFIDKTGIDILIELIQTLQSKSITTSLVNFTPEILHLLSLNHFLDRVHHQYYGCRIFPTIHDAVTSFF